MRVVEVIIRDAENDPLARLGNPLEDAPVHRGGAGPAVLRRELSPKTTRLALAAAPSAPAASALTLNVRAL